MPVKGIVHAPQMNRQAIETLKSTDRPDTTNRAVSAIAKKYGTSIDPAIMDIVAHRYEATIPDWRQVQGLSDFEVKLRRGSELLRSNPEAYFLEGAYAQQIMGRSVDPDARTFTWYDVDDAGKPVAEHLNAGEVRQFFYTPEAAARYAFGGSVGNWHFFNAHAGDLADQAKYVLRSVDDGRGLLLQRGLKLSDYADVPTGQRQALVNRMYGNLSADMRNQVRALLDTCVNIRRLKSEGADLSSSDGLRRAYAPLIDLEKSLTYENKKAPALTEESLTRLAQDRFQRLAKTVLVDNMVKTSTARLTDWLSPQVKPKLRYWQGKMIDLDPQRQQRLQYAAFFELRDALNVMDADTIARVKRENPRFQRDIEILEGVIKKQREMMLTPGHVPESETTKWRKQQILDAEGLYLQLRKSLMNQLPDGMRGQVEQRLRQFNAAWAEGQRFEDWLQTGMFDAMLMRAGKPGAANMLMHLRESAAATNERFISPIWMARVAKANSLINILTAYHQQGEVNTVVLKAAAWEFFTYVPVIGLGMDIYAGKGTAAWNLVLVRVLPGYAVIMLYVNTMKGIATLAGTVVFAPLERDRIMLAYQGYLDPQDRGLVLAGLKNRKEGPRPGLMHWVDPQMELTLEERRKKFFEFFSPRVLKETNRRVPDGADPIFRDEWRNVYGEELLGAIDRYLDEWSKGTGEWAEFASLAANTMFDVYLWEKETTGKNKDRYKQPFPNKLKSMLIDDYMKGQELAAGKRITSREEVYQALLKDMSGLAGRSFLLDKEFDTVRDECKTAGHIAFAMAADDMPETPASIQIIVAPRVEEKSDTQDGASDSGNGGESSTGGKGDAKRLVSESVQLRAKVAASEKAHPAPWSIQWRVEHKGQAKELPKEGTNEQIQAEGGGAVIVHAKAVDAEGTVFAETSVNLEIERWEIKGDDQPAFVDASGFDDEEKDDRTGNREEKPPASKYLLWIEERGTWCWFRSGTERDYEKVRGEGIFTQQMAGPYNSREELEKGASGFKQRAKVLDIPGHGRKHYVEVGGRICFLGVADMPGGDGDGGTTGADAGSGQPREWTLQVTVVDGEGTPVEGAEVKLADTSTKGRELGGGRYLIGPLSIPRDLKAPLTVLATTDRMAGGLLRMEHSQAKHFFPQKGATTSITVQFNFATEERPDPPPGGGGGGPPPPPSPTPVPPVEHIWKFDLGKPFEIKAIAPAKTKSTCQAGAEVLDEARIQVVVEQENR